MQQRTKMGLTSTSAKLRQLRQCVRSKDGYCCQQPYGQVGKFLMKLRNLQSIPETNVLEVEQTLITQSKAKEQLLENTFANAAACQTLCLLISRF